MIKIDKKVIRLILVVFTIFIGMFFSIKYLILDGTEIKNKTYTSSGSKKLYAACDSGYNTVTAKFMRDFAKRVEKKSNGRIEIETYSDSQVGGDLELLDSCKSGNVAFVFQTTAPQATLIPQVSIFDVPMAFEDVKIARRVLDGEILNKLKPYYREKGLEILGFSDQGFREMTSNKYIRKINDFSGVKIRTMENPYHIMFWKNLGANPTPMAYSEVYIGLQQGVVDAQENPIEAIIGPKFYEQQKYMIMTNHILHAVGCTASKDIMDKLNKEDRKIIYESIEESIVWSRKETDRLLDKRMNIIKNSGTKVININDNLKKEMKKRSYSIWTNVEKRVGKDLMNTFKYEIDKQTKNN